MFSFSSDEEDLRAEQLLLKDKWRSIFDQFDPEGFGEIPWSEFLVVINSDEFKSWTLLGLQVAVHTDLEGDSRVGQG